MRTLALALVVLVASGCGGHKSSRGKPRTVVDVGYAFGFDSGDVGDRVAFSRLERGSRLSFRFKDLGGAPNAVVALVRGDVQLATMPYSTAIRAITAGAKVRAVVGQNIESEFLLVGGPGIRNVAALRGRRVAFDKPGLDGETLVNETLGKAKVPRSAVELSALGESTSRAAALSSGRIDAAVLENVDYLRLRQTKPGITILSRLSDFRPRSAQTVWVVAERYEQKHPALVQQLVDGLLDGYGFVYTEAGRTAWLALARKTVLAHTSATLAPGVYDFYRQVRFWPIRDEPVTAAQHEKTIRFWLRVGQLEQDVAFSRVWDDHFWRDSARA
jgi:ABC-type nitrate/sulfonate/bicarbonate transport system substrate-binding protein